MSNIFGHTTIKKNQNRCAPPGTLNLHCHSTHVCPSALYLERYCLQPSRPEHSEYRGLFGFNWNLNMLTSILLTLREFFLFPFSQAWAIKQQFHWPQLCLLTVSVLLFILAAAKQPRVKRFSCQMDLVSTDATAGSFTYPAGSYLLLCHLSPPVVLVTLWGTPAPWWLSSSSTSWFKPPALPSPVTALGASSALAF